MWLVCQNKDGDLFLQTRAEREIQIGALIEIGNGVPTFVLQAFEEKRDAIDFIARIEEGKKIINNLL